MTAPWNSLPVDALLTILADAAVKGGVVLLAASVAVPFMRGASAAARHLVWLAAVTVALLVPIASIVLPAHRIRVLSTSPLASAPRPTPPTPTPETAPRIVSTDANIAGTQRRETSAPPFGPLVIVRRAAPTGNGSPAGAEIPTPVKTIRPAVASSQAAPSPLAHRVPLILLSIWCAGAAAVFARWVVGVAAAWRLARRTPAIRSGRVFDAFRSAQSDLRVRGRVELKGGANIVMPLATALLRPALLLPADAAQWPAEQLRAVLLHELAHVRRFDCATQWLAQLACAAYWFNPLAWLAALRLRVERERACDDMVLSLGLPPASYAQHLLTIARALRVQPSLTFGAVGMARRSGLRQRVADILDGGVNRRKLSSRLAFGTGLMSILVLLGLASVRLAAREAAAPAAAAPHATTQPATQPSGPAAPSARVLHLTVIDRATGKPVENAKVAFAHEPHEGHTATDARGEVDVDWSSSPDSWVIVEHPHYVGTRVSWATRGKKETAPDAYTLRFEPGTDIGGKVIDDAGQPIAGAHVVARVDGDKAPGSHESVWISYEDVTTAADGAWHFDDIPASFKRIDLGAWDFHHLENGFFPIQEFSPISALRDGSATFTLKRGVPITGTVYGPDGKPLKDAWVAFGADRIASNCIDELKTDDHGAFSLAAQPQSMAVLTVHAPGCAPELQQALLGTAPLKMDFHLSPAGTISGTVVNAAGQPLARAYVWFDTWRGRRTNPHTARTDAEGRFTWPDAPKDTVYADVSADGYARQNAVPMTAGQPLRVTLQDQLKVTGTVVDADTGRPVPSFRVVHGISWNDGRPVFWERSNRPENGKDGRFSFSPSFPYPAYAVRIEAEGYSPAESRTFTDAERKVELNLKLHKAADLVVRVTTADGKPAEGAHAALVEPGKMALLADGRRVQQGDSEQSNVKADGSLTFTPRPGGFRVIVFGDAGYAEASAEQVRAGQPIVLQPWARVEGVLQIGSKAGGGQRVVVDPRESPNEDPGSPTQPHIMHQIGTMTDAAGHFAFDRIPPGEVRVSREVDQPMGSSWAAMRAQSQSLTLAPGQVATVTLGGRGRPVVGRVQIPPELATRKNWVFDSAQTRTNLKRPPLPMPDDVKAGTLEQKQAWLKEFNASEAGKDYSAFVKRLNENQHYYPVQIAQDGTFRIDDVEAGTYAVAFGIGQQNGSATCGPGDIIASGSTTFTVPEMPGGRSDQPLELPPVLLEKVFHLNVGDAAPEFAAKTLDGKPIKLSDFRGKYVLLDFWATWCGPCVAETPHLKSAFDAIGGNDRDRIVMISLSLDEKPEAAAQYVRQNKLDWPQVFLPGEWESPTVKAYGVRGIPSIWLIDPDGKVVAKDLRGEQIRGAVQSALRSTK